MSCLTQHHDPTFHQRPRRTKSRPSKSREFRNRGRCGVPRPFGLNRLRSVGRLDTALGDWSGWYFGTGNLRYGPRAASFDEGSNGWKTFGGSGWPERMAHLRMGRSNRQPRQVVFGLPGAAAKWPGISCGFIRMQVQGKAAKPAEAAFGRFRLVGWERIDT